MKKTLLAILAVVAVSAAHAQTPAFPDVPAGHWAGEAVARLTDLGIIIGFPDGTFRGNESFTRYQAALVISRLIDVINSDMAAAQALTDADIAALRNALQELASDVAAAQSDIMTISGDVLSNTQRIAALEDAISMLSGMDMSEGAIAVLQAELDAARADADEALSAALFAEALAAEAIELVNELAAQVSENTANIEALGDLVAILSGELGDGAPSVLADVQRNTNDIANIREFVILLRRNQVAIDGRVTALEASQVVQDEEIASLGARLDAVEERLITVGGRLQAMYSVGRLSGDGVPFDVDRVYGLNNVRDMREDSVFGEGQGSVFSSDDSNSVDREDITSSDGGLNVSMRVDLGFGAMRSHPTGANVVDAAIRIRLQGDNVLNNRSGDGPAGGFDASPNVRARLDGFSTVFRPIGSDPLTFDYGFFGARARGTDQAYSFTPYIFSIFYDNDDDDGAIFTGATSQGFIARAGSPDFLSFLNPRLEVVYGSLFVGNADEFGGDPITGSTTLDNTYFRGIRGTLSPLEGLTGGVSFAQLSTGAGENADAAEDNIERTVIGADLQLENFLGFIDVNAEFAQASLNDNATASLLNNAPANYATQQQIDDIDYTILYVEVDVNPSDLPILNRLRANYRTISKDWLDLALGLKDNDKIGLVFDTDQEGFGVAAELNLFILDLQAYFDTYTIDQTRLDASFGSTDTANDVVAFGAGTEVGLFSGFSVYGFFENVTVGGTTVDSVEFARTEGQAGDADFIDYGDRFERNSSYALSFNPRGEYNTAFGAGLRHDGSADNALIRNLNLDFTFSQVNAGFDTTRIDASLDYTLDISVFSLTPYGRLLLQTGNPDDDQFDITAIGFGTGLATQPLNIPLRPSLVGVVNYQQTDLSGHATDRDFTASQFQYSVGVAFTEFLSPRSNLVARYGYFVGENINAGRRDGQLATRISSDRTYAGVDLFAFDNNLRQSTWGYELVWNYADLEIAYGVYQQEYSRIDGGREYGDSVPVDLRDTSTAAQAFSISYRLVF